jgi:hypothetical protein
VVASYREIRKLLRHSAEPSQARTAVFETADRQQVEAAYARIQDAAGLDWIIVVAVPRSDFLLEVSRTDFKRTVALALLASLMTIVIGLMVLSVVDRRPQTAGDQPRATSATAIFNATLDVTRQRRNR